MASRPTTAAVTSSLAARRLRKELRRVGRTLHTARPDAEAIHDARDRIKRARATLRLLRPQLKKGAFRKGDRLLHRVTAPLGSVRDGAVLIDKLDALLHQYHGAGALVGTESLRRALDRDLSRKNDTLRTDKRLRRRIDRLLERASTTAKDRKHSQRRDSVRQGLRRTYREAREALHRAQRKATVKSLHTLRKRTKDLELQLRFIEKQTASGHGRSAAFRRLADTLGDDHDLAVLHKRIAEDPSAMGDMESQTRLIALIEQHRLKLQRRAFLQAAHLYKIKSREFARRFA